MIYIKVRKQVPQVSQVVTLSPIKQEKALLGQIVSTPNSSATFRKSCTTFGRRNYLLRLSQIFKNQCDLTRLLERLKEDYITNFTAAQLFFSRWWTKVMPKLSAFSRMKGISST